LGLELTRHPTTARPDTFALVALMLLNAARLPARADDAGNPLRLDEQDRSRWNQAMIQRGVEYLVLAGTGTTLSTYHLEAAIAACHSAAPCAADTNWPRILSLYDRLLELDPSPLVAMNRAVAVARTQGADQGLAALDAIRPAGALDGYLFHHAVRGVLAAEAGRKDEARRHLARALELATLPGERAFLRRQLEDLGGVDAG
jgi:predicted RNA polymerase sigma factor